jgi:hypothetical protein
MKAKSRQISEQKHKEYKSGLDTAGDLLRRKAGRGKKDAGKDDLEKAVILYELVKGEVTSKEPLPVKITDKWCSCDKPAKGSYSVEKKCTCGMPTRHMHCSECGGVSEMR